MLKSATCLLIQDEKNYYLTPYTDEDEKTKPGQIVFSLVNALTSITIWPHKDESNPLDDVKKQLCLKFIELNHGEYASDLRAASTVEFLMEQLDETQKVFVNAVMEQFVKSYDAKLVHKGGRFETDIVQINLNNMDVALPQGFVCVDKKRVDEVAFQHASLEALKVCVGWPAMKTLNADPTSGAIFETQALFHPFALQLNNTVLANKEKADEIAADDVKTFQSQYHALKQSAASKSSTQFQVEVTDQEIQGIYAPLKRQLEDKLSRGLALQNTK
jgi:hypothetical protein